MPRALLTNRVKVHTPDRTFPKVGLRVHLGDDAVARLTMPDGSTIERDDPEAVRRVNRTTTEVRFADGEVWTVEAKGCACGA